MKPHDYDRAGEAPSDAGGPGGLPTPEALGRFFLDLPFAVVFTDEGGTYRWANPAAERLLGRPIDALVGSTVWDLATEGERARLKAHYESYEETGAPESGLIELRRGDGTPRWFRYNARPCVDGLHWSVLEDVTDTLAARRAEVDERNEGIVHVAGGVAHIFNNLLTAIIGCAELARGELPEGHAASQDLAEIHEAALKGAEVSRQLLLVSGSVGAPQVEVDLGAVARSVAAKIATVRDRPRIDVEIEPGLPSIWGVGPQLELAAWHLVANAVEASEDVADARVTVTVRSRERLDPHAAATVEPGGTALGPHVELAVRDEGPGFDPALIPRAFDPFVSSKRVGRGLGLAVVLGVARTHAGVVWVAGRVPGVPGATVAVGLPTFGDADDDA